MEGMEGNKREIKRGKGPEECSFTLGEELDKVEKIFIRWGRGRCQNRKNKSKKEALRLRKERQRKQTSVE